MGDDPVVGGDYGYSAFDLAQNPLAGGFGKPSTAERSRQMELMDQMAEIPAETFRLTQPTRKNLSKTLADFTAGDVDVFSMPMFQGEKAGIEQNYDIARRNTLETMPSGGALFDRLGGIETDRARALTEAGGDIQQDLLNKAMAASFGTTGEAQEGVGAAANQWANYLFGKDAAASDTAKGIGSMIGSYMAK